MTLPELIKSFLDSSRERIKTPITGAYMIAFLLYNWRPLSIYLFADLDMTAKIIEINEHYCGWDAILVPLAIAIIYTALVPYIMMIMEILTVKAAKKRITLKADNRDHYLKAQEKLIYQEFINEEQRTGKRTQEQITVEITGYKDRIQNLAKQIEENGNYYKEELSKKDITIQELRNKISDINVASGTLTLDEAEKILFKNIRDSLSDNAKKNLAVASILNDHGKFEEASNILNKSLDELEMFGLTTKNKGLVTFSAYGEKYLNQQRR